MEKWKYIEVTDPLRDDGKCVRIHLNGNETFAESKSSTGDNTCKKRGICAGRYIPGKGEGT